MEEQRKKEEEEAKKKKGPSGYRPTDVNRQPETTSYTPSPYELEALEDAMEELS